jgi:hypothetical protein
VERESAARRKSFIMMFRVGAVLLSKKKGSWWYSRSFGFMGDWGLGWSTVLFRPAGEYVFTIDNKHKREVLLAQTQRLVLLGGNRFLPAENTLFLLFFVICLIDHPPGLISGFSGGKKNINFFFGQNIARVKIVP